MPLVPGVQVTNAVRDFMAGDYLSGMIGIQAAIFVSTAIALGSSNGIKISIRRNLWRIVFLYSL